MPADISAAACQSTWAVAQFLCCAPWSSQLCAGGVSEPGLQEGEGLTGGEAVLECALACSPEGLLGRAHPALFSSGGRELWGQLGLS